MIDPVVEVRGAVRMKIVHTHVKVVECCELYREGIVRGEEVELSVQLAAGGVGVELITRGDQLLSAGVGCTEKQAK
jgi:hypothetical protein